MISQSDITGSSTSDFEPCYLRLHRSGELAKRVKRARRHM